MTPSLREELKQDKPFSCAEQEVHLGIERTAAVVGHAFAEAIKPFGVTPTQYNVLRVLRGAGKEGLCRHEIRDRLVSEVPDVTRLLDRMEDAGLIVRERDTEDRRLVATRITPAGLELLKKLERPVLEAHRQHFGHLSAKQLLQLSELLELVRSGEK